MPDIAGQRYVIERARGYSSGFSKIYDETRFRIENADKEFIAWLAGFFDGEGTLYISFYKTNSPRNVKLRIGQSGERGKKICEEIARKLGGVVLEYQPKNPRWKKVYIWEVRERDRVIEIAELLLPYLRVKAGEKIKIFERNIMHTGYGYKIDVEDAVDKIHDILDNYDDYKAKLEGWRQKVLYNEYRWDIIAKKLFETINN